MGAERGCAGKVESRVCEEGRIQKEESLHVFRAIVVESYEIITGRQDLSTVAV